MPEGRDGLPTAVSWIVTLNHLLIHCSLLVWFSFNLSICMQPQSLKYGNSKLELPKALFGFSDAFFSFKSFFKKLSDVVFFHPSNLDKQLFLYV